MKSYEEVKTKFFLPDWYDPHVHNMVISELTNNGKLHACKLLRDESNKHPQDNEMTLTTCRELCDFITGREAEAKPVLVTVNEEDDLVSQVANLINDDIQNHYDLTGLCSLLKYVPENVLRDYLEENKPA